jgi:opacity protein-like surface antigen
MRLTSPVRVFALFALLVLGHASRSNGQGFVNPFLDYHFGGDSVCPTALKCDTARVNLGVSVGALGAVVGFEEDFSFGNNFFGTEPLLSSDVVTLMSNLLIAPKIGPVRPYGVAGIGLIRTTSSSTLANIVVSDSNNVGYDLGGGLMIFFGRHVGVRADIRGYRSLQDLKLFGLQVPDTKLQFGRANGGLVFVF